MTFIEEFEAFLVPPSSFHHAQHIRLAFDYLGESELLTALERFRSALRRFADHHGAKRLYNETITVAYLLLIHDRMQRSGVAEWEAFVAANGDLFAWKPSILDTLYRRETLTSTLARRAFLLPDAWQRELSP